MNVSFKHVRVELCLVFLVLPLLVLLRSWSSAWPASNEEIVEFAADAPVPLVLPPRWQEVSPRLEIAGSVSDVSPFKDPRKIDPFGRLRRYLAPDQYLLDLYRKGTLLTSEQWEINPP